MREKGKKKKEKKILIRVNREEKKDAEEFAKKEGKNVSEFFRGLLEEYKRNNNQIRIYFDPIKEQISRIERDTMKISEIRKSVKKILR